MNQPVIELQGLSKRYPGTGRWALNKLSLSVGVGETYGFLGPNGAGKSTTIRLLLNFIQPSAGSGQILGRDIVTDSVAVKKSIGYLAGEISLYDKMSGRDFLAYMAKLQPPKNKKYAVALAKKFKADLTTPIKELSKGSKQKIGLIQAFAHQPEVIVLDEPTSGLDPLMQEQFFELVGLARADGATLFISSHNLTEVQKICDRAGFIRQGKLIKEQNIAEAIADSARSFDITFENELPLAELKDISGAELSSGTRNGITVHMRGDLAPLFRVLAHHKVASINQRQLNLEEEFIQFYDGEGKT